MFKNLYFKLGLISAITTLSILISLPKIPIKMDNSILQLDSSIGGYKLTGFDGETIRDLSKLKKGLDLEGGIRIVLKADMLKIQENERDNALESAKDIISRRVDMLGVNEPHITTLRVGEDYRIIVEIPGIEDITSAMSLIGQTAQLSFKELDPSIEWDQEKVLEYFQNPSVWVDTGLTGGDMKGAEVLVGQGGIQDNGSPQVQLNFTEDGRKMFSDVAKRNINRPIGIFLDNESIPLSMPIVSPDLAEGLTSDPVISGNFDLAQAKNLSIQIRAGALPVPVEILEHSTTGATLGDISIQKSFFAAIVGLALVALFLVFRYGRLGILASISLVIYSFIVLAIFKLIPVTLTLPGIAGFILSIGMATDANILIFERIREELYWGKPGNLAIRLGFERAWDSIKDSNISSLITSFILFQLGSGPVRGFALTLAIGIIVSLFTSIVVVKTFIDALNMTTSNSFGGKK